MFHDTPPPANSIEVEPSSCLQAGAVSMPSTGTVPPFAADMDVDAEDVGMDPNSLPVERTDADFFNDFEDDFDDDDI
ncbi:hypothetical protein AB1Y20_023649 [Prymnesium parvum]|uniref:Centrosomal protein of 19 kDa n=1 Tax=Prymnesium parvum TaxID=97485 RepID=A0AB34JHP5_PRYPA